MGINSTLYGGLAGSLALFVLCWTATPTAALGAQPPYYSQVARYCPASAAVIPRATALPGRHTHAMRTHARQLHSGWGLRLTAAAADASPASVRSSVPILSSCGEHEEKAPLPPRQGGPFFFCGPPTRIWGAGRILFLSLSLSRPSSAGERYVDTDSVRHARHTAKLGTGARRSCTVKLQAAFPAPSPFPADQNCTIANKSPAKPI